MLETIGWLGSLMLAICGLPQAILSWKTGNANGVSSLFLALWLVGEILVAIYIWPKQDWPLLVNYGVNILCLLVIARYKIYPTKK